ncbi:MAG: nucleotidyl transferase AbiEii/AbiGii toxin family protein [Deltaproteobacteria bacterium]|nr:nucleotidyl transferase AbiEii/AbiGii toxin family protein [Deltaproteobacteria bacterium]
MKPNKQDFFNQYRENVIIEVVQALAKSDAGSQIAFKGGTALKLFYDLPRYSEDIDYDVLPGGLPDGLIGIIKSLCTKKRWEVTDNALKYHTILVELRFRGPDRNFHIKIEISTREKELKTAILPLRGVPIVTLEPSFLMTEKLLTYLDRQAGRDIFDTWFILNGAYPLDEAMIARAFENRSAFFQALLNTVKTADPKKILRDTGKLLNQDYRNWIQTSFLADLERLIKKQM